MRIAVSGATGFLGRLVMRRLSHDPVDLVAVQRSRGELGSTAEVVIVDLTDPPRDAYERLGRPDIFIHLAWDGLPNYHSLHHFEQELPRQFAFLRMLLDAGLPRLVCAGTCFEYGAQTGSLAEDLPAQPTNAYGFAKHCLRQQLNYLLDSEQHRLLWCRLFYLWDELQPASSLYGQLRQAVTNGQNHFDMSGGEQLRDYLPASTVADYLVRIAMQTRCSGVVNICSGQAVSVRSLVERWISENQWTINPRFGVLPYPSHEPMAFWGDAKKLQQWLCDPNPR